jgi:hypothetical protein
VTLVFVGSGPAPGSVGFGLCVSVCPPLLSDIVVVPSGVPISAPLLGSLDCNSVAVPAGDESVVRSLSADNAACAAGEPNAFVDSLDFSDNL